MFKAFRLSLAATLTALAFVATCPVTMAVLSVCATAVIVTVMIDEIEAVEAE